MCSVHMLYTTMRRKIKEPMFVSAWVGGIHFARSLVDGGSLVELLSEKAFEKLNLPVHRDEGREISLAGNRTAVSQRYAMVPVNVCGVLATLECYLINVSTYELLLGVRWMRRVRFAMHYGTGEAGITGTDGVYIEVPHEMAPIEREEVQKPPRQIPRVHFYENVQHMTYRDSDPVITFQNNKNISERPLWKGELSILQILVDDEFNITGIIDWEWAHMDSKSGAFNSPIVRNGRFIHIFRFCCGYDLVDWKGFLGLFAGLLEAMYITNYFHWETWKTEAALECYQNEHQLQQVIEIYN